MRVLCDAIHADLWESLRILFEDRFGWELYRPIGMDWYDSGIWRFERERLGDAVAKQFLTPWEGDGFALSPLRTSPPLGYSLRTDETHPGQVTKLVTMEQARSMQWDIVLSTLAENDEGWAGFAREAGAHFGIQVGNQGAPVAWGAAEFAMLSVTTPGFTPWRPHVYYRQEFSLTDFYPDAGYGGLQSQEVQTRVQCFTGTPDYALFKQLAATTGYPFLWYGHCGEQDHHYGGNAFTTPEVAQQMHGARIAYHAKRWSDGYGHVIHNWAAIGRPMLVTGDYYADKLAAPLFSEGETSFNLERLGVGDLTGIINRLQEDDEYYQRICSNAAKRFRSVVDFDAEAGAIRAMLDNVLSDPVPR